MGQKASVTRHRKDLLQGQSRPSKASTARNHPQKYHHQIISQIDMSSTKDLNQKRPKMTTLILSNFLKKIQQLTLSSHDQFHQKLLKR